MKIKREKALKMIEEVESIIQSCLEAEKKNDEILNRVHPELRESARNLIHYRSMRTHDLRSLQKKLGNMGLSRLAKSESHVLASLRANLTILNSLIGRKNHPANFHYLTIKQGVKLGNRHARDLFGNRSKNRKVRIMVTQPDESAKNPQYVLNLVKSGMNTVRINCAHDGPSEWKKMIDYARQAMEKVGRTCKVTMDLGGPKIRTGSLVPGPKVLHLQPERDVYGRITAPGMAFLVDQYPEEPDKQSFIPVPANWRVHLKIGDEIVFVDTRKKKRTLKVAGEIEGKLFIITSDTCYIETGTVLKHNLGECQVGEMPPVAQFILLKIGDILEITFDPVPGEPAEFNQKGDVVKAAHISCTAPEIFHYLQEGERILFDDGKIEGRIKEVGQQKVLVEIIQAREKGSKLRADKGINLPDTSLKISGLTAKDKEDLEFVVAHADVVNMSFVNSKQDVEDLINRLEQLGALDKIGIILKIETKQAFENLVDILLAAMRIEPIGVMIARGDLAIECGWKNIGRIQEEILWLCQAGHVPTVWATQVLENLAKKGIPSRAEITDAVMSQRADCVMLNKGANITGALKMLDSILQEMQDYQERKSPLLPPLQLVPGEKAVKS